MGVEQALEEGHEHYRRACNPGVTEIKKIAGRGHALTIDSGWKEIAEVSLAFIKRFV